MPTIALNHWLGHIVFWLTGDITPNEVSSIAGVIEPYRQTLETMELEGRLSALESKI